MRKLSLVLLAVCVTIVVGFAVSMQEQVREEEVVTIEECGDGAIVCPDGTVVHMSGPDCSFGPCPDPIPIEEPRIDFTATFEIYTFGTRRIFTQSMYHNLSPEAYITMPDPSVIHVQAPDITWQIFFDTLPFELSDTCLVTGLGEQYCTGVDGELVFLLNGFEMEDVLQMDIQPDDELVVRFE